MNEYLNFRGTVPHQSKQNDLHTQKFLEKLENYELLVLLEKAAKAEELQREITALQDELNQLNQYAANIDHNEKDFLIPELNKDFLAYDADELNVGAKHRIEDLIFSAHEMAASKKLTNGEALVITEGGLLLTLICSDDQYSTFISNGYLKNTLKPLNNNG